MAISAPGVGSNLDVNGIVSQLMTIEQRPRDLLDAKEASYQAQLSAYGQLRGALSALESAVEGLADPTRFEKRSATAGDTSVLSASAGAAAANATYDVAVTQLAQRQSLTTAGQASATSAIGSGASTVLTFDFGTISGGTVSNGIYTGASFAPNESLASRTVTIDASNNSLQGIRDAINAANIGVNASILNVGGSNPYRLVLQSASGASAALRIGVSGDATLASLLAYDPAGSQNLTQTVAAQDATLTVNGLAITSGSNNVTDAIQGVTLALAKVGTTSVTIGRDPTAAQQGAQAFVKAYNDLNTMLHDLTRFDATGSSSGALVGDSAARTIQSQLRNALSSALAGGNSNTLRVLSQVGMSFQKDGSLTLDNGKLAQMLTTDPVGVARMFASGGVASDSLINVAGSTSATVPGSYAVEITQLATRGQLIGSAAAQLTVTAGVNDVLAVNVDGAGTTLTLPAGTYTAATLAAQVQSLINASTSLRTANSQVSLSESGGVFTLASKRYGSASTVSVSGSAAASLFGAAPSATAGTDVAGSIGGFSATGSGQRLTAAAGSPTIGLALDITGGSTGSRGVVSFARGYAARLDGLLQGLLARDGAIASRTTGINATIKDIGSQRDVLNRRLTDIEARYRKQFTDLDTLMSSMTATSTFLTQQLQQLQSSGK